jgi:hypothetical protein
LWKLRREKEGGKDVLPSIGDISTIDKQKRKAKYEKKNSDDRSAFYWFYFFAVNW